MADRQKQLTWVLGPDEVERNRYIAQQAIDYAKMRPLRPVWLIVPEQFTLYAQQEIIQAAGGRGILNIEVLSFNRLPHRLADRLKMADHLPLTALGAKLLIYQLMIDYSTDFRFMHYHSTDFRYMKELYDMLSESHQYNLSEDELFRLSNQADNQRLSDKLHDLGKLLVLYRNKINQHYQLPETVFSQLIEAISEDEQLEQAAVFVNGFYGFLPVQKQILKALLEKSGCLTIALPYDLEPEMIRPVRGTVKKTQMLGLGDLRDESHLFYETRRTISWLADFINDTSVDERIEWVDWPRERPRDGLAHLRDYLYRPVVKSFGEKTEQIVLNVAGDIQTEVRYVAEKILQLTRQSGYRYKQIAVLCTDLIDYRYSLQKIFEEYQLAYFMDAKENLGRQPLTCFILSLLRLASYDCRYEDVVSHVKSVYFKVEDYEDESLQDGKNVQTTEMTTSESMEDSLNRWLLTIFEQGIRGRQSIERMMDDEEWQVLGELVRPLLQTIRQLQGVSKLKDKNGALREYIVVKRVDWVLEGQVNKFGRQQEHAKASVYQQMMAKLEQLLLDIDQLMGERMVSVREYLTILQLALDSTEIGNPPSSIDQVIIGDLERTRLPQVKIVFILGVTEGKLPRISDSQTLFTERERAWLSESGALLAPTKDKAIEKSKLTLYMTMTKATDQLYFSYARRKDDKESYPATLFYQLRRLFPNNRLNWVESRGMMRQAVGLPKTTFHWWLEQLMQLDWLTEQADRQHFVSIYQLLANDERLMLNFEAINKGLDYHNRTLSVTPALTEAMYQQVISISRLETFASCPFAHFMNYGLALKEIKPFVVETSQLGNLLHKVLEEYVRSYYDETTNDYLPSSVRRERLEVAIDRVLLRQDDRLFKANARNKYVLNRVNRVLERMIWAYETAWLSSDFKPRWLEYQFGQEDTKGWQTPAGQSFYLKGIIDRVDLCDADEAIYYSIIDYKSGAKDIDFVKLYHGLQLQLFVYAEVVERKLVAEAERQVPVKPVTFAGLAYHHLMDPVLPEGAVELEQTTEIVTKDALLKALRPNGLFMKDLGVIQHLDHRVITEKQSQTLPIVLKKDGDFNLRSSKVIEADEMKKVKAYTKAKVSQLAGQIFAGETAIRPYRLKNGETACTYCPYADICRIGHNSVDNYKYITNSAEECRKKMGDFMEKDQQAQK